MIFGRSILNQPGGRGGSHFWRFHRLLGRVLRVYMEQSAHFAAPWPLYGKTIADDKKEGRLQSTIEGFGAGGGWLLWARF